MYQNYLSVSELRSRAAFHAEQAQASPMTCLQLLSSLLPMDAKHKPQQHHIWHTTKLLWGKSSKTVPQHFPSASPLRTKALPHFIVVAATSPPKSADPSTFLPIRSVFFPPVHYVVVMVKVLNCSSVVVAITSRSLIL